MSNDNLTNFEDEDEYKLKKIGSYGRFTSSTSFPIDYILTTFDADQLDELTLARDIKPDKLDFELLMQRDIDEERVANKIEPYLNPKASEKLNVNQIIFFPPILAAVVPVKSNEMQSYYTNDETKKEGSNRYVRTFEGLFKLTFVAANGSNAYSVSVQQPDLNNEININKTTTQIEMRQAKGANLGVKLVVIDGQHRLRALQLMSKKNPDSIADLVLPVCLLFPTNSNEKYVDEYTPTCTPTIHEVFRKLFVDVNKTAEAVGGHFNILLSDSDIGNLICRSFCSALDKDHLAVIEWNTKQSKDSTIIKRNYSLTSIGVLDQALDECFKDKKELSKYLLNIKANDFKEPDEYQDICWSTFTVEQKSILNEKIKNNVTPLIVDMFFKVEQFKLAYDIFLDNLNKFSKNVDASGEAALDHLAAIEFITEYKPTNNKDAEKLVQTFTNNVKAARSDKVAPIIEYAIFQRAIIESWVRLLSYGKRYSLSPGIITSVFIKLIDKSLQNKGEYFSSNKSYNIHSVFSITGNIMPTKTTKTALSNAIFAHFGDDSFTKKITDDLGLPDEKMTIFESELQKDGISSASKFLAHYEKNRRKTFIKTYPVDYEMTSEEKSTLADAEDLYKRHLIEVKEKKREKKDITTEFDLLIEKYVKEDLERAYSEMSKALNYDEEILNYSSSFEDEDDDDSEDD